MDFKLVLSCLLEESETTTIMPGNLSKYIHSRNNEVPSEVISGVLYPALAVKNLDFVSIKSVYPAPLILGLPRVGLEGRRMEVLMENYNMLFDAEPTCRAVAWGRGLADINSRFQLQNGAFSRFAHSIKGRLNPNYNPLVEELVSMREQIRDSIELLECDINGTKRFYVPGNSGSTLCDICGLSERGIKIEKPCDMGRILCGKKFSGMNKVELADFFIELAKKMYLFDFEEGMITEALEGVIASHIKSLKELSDNVAEMHVQEVKKVARSTQKEIEDSEKSSPGTI